MFSLIVTVIAIVLVAALALAAMYYGGQAMHKNGTRARATTLITQSQQILGSAQLFKATQGRWPVSMDELISSNHLKSVPIPPLAQAVSIPLLPTAYADDTAPKWATVQSNAPFYWVHKSISADVCREVNLMARGDNGIYNAAKPSLQAQCFGTDEMYTVVLGFPGATAPTMAEAVGTADPVLVVDESGSGWSRPPSQSGATAPVTGADPTASPLSANSVQFGSVVIGANVSNGLTVTNHTANPVTISSLTGLPASIVANTTGTNVCGTAGYVLAANASCQLVLKYTPTVAGPVSATATLNSNYAGQPAVSFTVSGTATAPALPAAALSASTVAFGSQAVNSSVAKPVTVTNTGTAPLTVTAASVNDTVNYAVDNQCTTVAPSASCVISVSFVPKTIGTKPASLSIVSNAPASPQTVSLTGTSANVAAASWSTTDFKFDDQAQNSGSGRLTATLTNTGSANLLNLSASLSDTTNYSVSGCTTSLVPGASCELVVVFAPTALGILPSTISFSSSAPNSPQTLTLSGTGIEAKPSDPSQWETGTFPKSGSYTSIAYASGVYWATGPSGSGLMKSYDGLNYTWTTGWGNGDAEVKAIGDVFLLATNQFDSTYMHANASSGTGKTGTTTGAQCCVKLTADVATGTWYGMPQPMNEWYFQTKDGVNWTQGTFPARPAGTNNSGYVWSRMAVGNGTRLVTNGYYYSTTASGGWSAPALFPSMTDRTTQTVDAVTYGGGKFVATGSNGFAYTSSDSGKTWTRVNLPTTDRYYTLVYGDGTFLAVGYGTTNAAYSKDGGLTWISTKMPLAQYWYGATYGQGRFTVTAAASATFARSKLP